MTPRAAATSAAAGMTMVTIGSMTANVAAYLLQLFAATWLGPAGYGEFASLLAAQLVLAVPALALQTVVAREVVLGSGADALRRLGLRCAAIVAVLAALLVVPVAAALHTSVGATAAALLTAPVLVLLAAEQGLLQGRGRFRELSVVLAAAGVAKVPAVAVLAVGGGPGVALVATAVGTAVVAAGARVVVGREVGSVAETAPPAVGVAAVLRASQVQLALIALSSVDLLLSRVVLDEAQAGQYALGAVATKIAFWLPAAVGVVLYPRMANPAHSAGAIRSALGVLVGLGAVMVAAAALAAPLAPLLAGRDYASVQGLLWAFALDGACLAVLQGALLSAIARERTLLALVAWAGLAVEVTLILTVASSMRQLILITVACAAVTAALVSVAALRGADTPPHLPGEGTPRPV
ncbi:polysaccharide biosynthesis protein [Rhodococcus spelaei]|uniref:Polysaccharide biosynthesis protein n=1 Tax=Rhodococcus spelaei TaxID=2546320 RepID=A0A541BA00_9NOCA|nr:polysaccharide biosynthesis protein [Rhodococcus spelaei]TQF69154.1 polysaccharide biosynthesis protein [Rhodococcus spelaei]